MPVTRDELHQRRIDCRGFRRSDGLWDVEGRVVDTKTYAVRHGEQVVSAGDPLHDMTLVLTFDSDLVICGVAVLMDATPYQVCSGAADIMSLLIGLQIKAGWLSEARKILNPNARCTHVFELLGPLATTAYQTLSIARGKPVDNPAKIDSCFAYSSARDVVRNNWPDRYTGES